MKDGVEYCGAAQDYSIKQGIIDRLTADKGKTDAKSVNRSILMVDMLFYGAEAQKRFDQVKYDGLVTALFILPTLSKQKWLPVQ